MSRKKKFTNPFRPGAGHPPPYLAGREEEKAGFRKLLEQSTILENLVLTGLRGVGKTVLLGEFKPMATNSGWLWVGTDLSESASLSEERIVTRLLADLAAITSTIIIDRREEPGFGFGAQRTVEVALTFEVLTNQFRNTPGLASDKLKAVLELVWPYLAQRNTRGVIFAYDEAQNLSDHADRDEFPVSLLLDVFQSLQARGLPLMLVLVGLPTLFPKLVEARTFAERMFHLLFLDSLSPAECRDAIEKPIEMAGCPYPLEDDLIGEIVRESGGYPYFVQFICREVYDVAVQKHNSGEPLVVHLDDITRKLDIDFFAGRWARATDRQRELMCVIASLDECDNEFSVQQITQASKTMPMKPFSPSVITRMLAFLAQAGLIYKNRHGRYSFAVPLLGRFIRRQFEE